MHLSTVKPRPDHEDTLQRYPSNSGWGGPRGLCTECELGVPCLLSFTASDDESPDESHSCQRHF